MIFDDVKKILVLAPHPDDAEFGLGGTLARLLELKKEVHVAVFSLCEKSTPEGFEIGDIEREMYRSMETLGIPKERIHVLDFEVRDFPSKRQEILEELVALRGQLKPDLVFLPSSSDIHQDHHTIHIEGIRAFKHSSLFGYEMPWNNFGFTSFVYVKLNPEHLDMKVKCLGCYETQKHRSYSSWEFVSSLARLRGGQIQEEFAESFELIRMIIR
ncbi:MAG: PIG-L family deacetylase [Flavobacteriales bacterium]|nr:PIG-L family deacetylase [Flavobacteriales bacterium]